MLYAIKGNRQVAIDEHDKAFYQGQDYRIATLEDGELVYEEVETEQTKLDEAKAEIEELTKVNKELKSKIKELETKGKAK